MVKSSIIAIFPLIFIMVSSGALALPHKDIIWSPTNQTYQSNPIPSSFQIQDPDADDSYFYANATMDGMLIFNNSHYQNDTVINNFTTLSNGVHTFMIGITDNNGLSRINSTIFTVDVPMGNATVEIDIPFVVTNQSCISNNTLQLVSMGIVDNVTHISTQNQFCNYGCDSLNNVCNPTPTAQNLIFAGIIFLFFVIVIVLAIWLYKK